MPDPDPNDSQADKDDPSTGSGQAKKPKPHVITRLQFMRDGEGYLTDVKRHIHVFDIATKKEFEIAHDRWDDGAPVWSPDGTLIAFSANRTDNPDANDNTDIFVVEARAGAKPRALTTWPGSDSSPAFSPDGKSIAYVRGGDSKDIWYATNNIALIAVSGGTPTILTARLDRNVRSPQFTADGRNVLFLLEEGGNVHLAIVTAAGGSIDRLLNGERDITTFDVAKTGDIVYLDSQPQQPGEIFFVARAFQARDRGAESPARDRGAESPAPQATRLTHVNDEFLAKIVYPGENHGIRRPSFQKDRYDRYIAWYEKYLKAPAIKTSSQ